MIGGAALSALPVADGGDNTQHGANLTLTHTLSISFTRGSTAPVATPSSPGGITVTPGGTWLVSADPPNIIVSP